jgi:hypothetical protein
MAECGERMPVVAHRRNMREWLAVLPMDALMKLLAL